jgi:hypothetical protein
MTEKKENAYEVLEGQADRKGQFCASRYRKDNIKMFKEKVREEVDWICSIKAEKNYSSSATISYSNRIS